MYYGNLVLSKVKDTLKLVGVLCVNSWWLKSVILWHKHIESIWIINYLLFYSKV